MLQYIPSMLIIFTTFTIYVVTKVANSNHIYYPKMIDPSEQSKMHHLRNLIKIMEYSLKLHGHLLRIFLTHLQLSKILPIPNMWTCGPLITLGQVVWYRNKYMFHVQYKLNNMNIDENINLYIHTTHKMQRVSNELTWRFWNQVQFHM